MVYNLIIFKSIYYFEGFKFLKAYILLLKINLLSMEARVNGLRFTLLP